ncbi:putative phage tail protein [Acidaminococcus sp. HCP3S3_G9_1]|uniref:putative phage tail protein n=1 Tax=Acidaminococcus sp. HCP3S3_G9_1 TaxID=3438732 RepID=UPI003F931E5F
MKHEWMRQAAINILRYLPEFLAKDKTFKATNDADSREHNTIRIDLQELLDQFFIISATYGLSDWEDLVGIETDPTLDLDARRQAVMAKLQNPESVTVAFLEKLINQYIADKSGTVTDHPETYSADFDIPLLDKKNLAGLTRDVRVHIPAHIGPVYKAHTIASTENRIAMIKSTVKTVDVYPAAVEQIKPESTYYVALAITTTEKLILQIGGI